MLPETPFYYRLSELKCRVGESVVHSPGYAPCTAQRAAVDLLHLRLGKVELTVSPQKSAKRSVGTCTFWKKKNVIFKSFKGTVICCLARIN